MRHELVMRGLRLPFFLPGVHQPGQGNFSPAKGRKTGYVVPLASSPGRGPCLAPAGFQRLSALTGPEARRWGMTPRAAPVGQSRLLRYSAGRGRRQLGPVNLTRWSLARSARPTTSRLLRYECGQQLSFAESYPQNLWVSLWIISTSEVREHDF